MRSHVAPTRTSAGSAPPWRLCPSAGAVPASVDEEFVPLLFWRDKVRINYMTWYMSTKNIQISDCKDCTCECIGKR